MKDFRLAAQNVSVMWHFFTNLYPLSQAVHCV
jgi:hypothetical protein